MTHREALTSARAALDGIVVQATNYILAHPERQDALGHLRFIAADALQATFQPEDDKATISRLTEWVQQLDALVDEYGSCIATDQLKIADLTAKLAEAHERAERAIEVSLWNDSAKQSAEAALREAREALKQILNLANNEPDPRGAIGRSELAEVVGHYSKLADICEAALSTPADPAA